MEEQIDNRAVKLQPIGTSDTIQSAKDDKPKNNTDQRASQGRQGRKKRGATEKQKAHLAKARAKRAKDSKIKVVVDKVTEKIKQHEIMDASFFDPLFKEIADQRETPASNQTVVDKAPSIVAKTQVFNEEYEDISVTDLKPNEIFVGQNPNLNYKIGVDSMYSNIDSSYTDVWL